MEKRDQLLLIGQRIKARRVEVGLSQQELADKVGYKSRSSINKIELGKADILQSSIRKIAEALYTSPAQLMGISDSGIVSPLPPNVTPMPKTYQVPRLGTIACGTPILAEQNIEGYDQIPDYVKCDFTLVCKGDSMTGARIHDGDIVCIKQTEEVESGQIAAVLIDGDFDAEATLKRVRFSENSVTLWPENPAYEPMVFTGAALNRVHIIGLATHFISSVK